MPAPPPPPSVGALQVFDGMLPWENVEKAPVASGRDGIDALPDSVLQHILGFLTAREAVQTCVLARRWRHLWKWTTALRVVCVGEAPGSLVSDLNFVDNMLCARGLVPLEMCELKFGLGCHGNTHIDISLEEWIQHVVLCEVQMLRVENIYPSGFELDRLSLISRNLVRLEIVGIQVNDAFCDLSRCPSLEYLEFAYCALVTTQKISSESLKCLSITGCLFDSRPRTLIDAPNLVSLRLDDHWCGTPFFQTVPSLHEAFVRVTSECSDCCMESLDDESYWNCYVAGCVFCNGIKQGTDSGKCLNLGGLSESENLSWIVESKLFLEWGWKWPTFTKLKTLLLNEKWCVARLAPDFHALSCILEHSPVLEKLTLQLFCKGHKYKFGMKGTRNPMDMVAAISEHLKIIEVQSVVIDEFVFKVLAFLSTLNFHFTLYEVEMLEEKLGTVMPCSSSDEEMLED